MVSQDYPRNHMQREQKQNRFKILIILFTLVIPVAVYVFLRAYGENHYTVPVLYESGIPADTSECLTLPENQQHLVRMNFAMRDIIEKPSDGLFYKKLSVIDIDMVSRQQPGDPGYPLNRVADIFTGNPAVQLIIIRPASNAIPVKQIPSNDRFIYVYGTGEEISGFARCELILLDFPEKNRRFILIDSLGRIRGYYQAGNFDEVDRLILEMKIILSEEFK
jgi:protein SCO1/2